MGVSSFLNQSHTLGSSDTWRQWARRPPQASQASTITAGCAMTALSLSAFAKSINTDLGKSKKVCDVHGEYESSGVAIHLPRGDKIIWSKCQKCKDAEAEAEAAKEAAAKALADKAQIEEAISGTALPARFIGKTLDSYIASTDGQVRALARAKAYAERFDSVQQRGDSLIFSGMVGTGKSHLAAGIIQAILPRHVGVYVTMLDLVRMLRDTWRRGSALSETDVLHRLSTVPLLVIDEIGVQYDTDAERTLFFDVMDRRYRNCKPVILLTNLGMAEFKATVGERVHDRLRETAKWVAFDWESHRGRTQV